jgi:hypothetical protein
VVQRDDRVALEGVALEAAGEDDLVVVVDGLRLDPGDRPARFGELRRRLPDDQADVFVVGVRWQDRIQGLGVLYWETP